MPATSARPPAPSGSPASSKDPGTDNRPGALLALVPAAQFMALLDVFVVHVAAPTIRAESGASGAELQLVVAGYTAGRPRGLDLPGLVLFAAVVGLFTVPLVLGQEHDWPAWTWLGPATAAVLLAAFLVYEARLARRGGAPLIAPRVLRTPGTGTAVARIALAMAINSGCVFALTPHLRSGLGYGALRAGLTSLPTAVAFGALFLDRREAFGPVGAAGATGSAEAWWWVAAALAAASAAGALTGLVRRRS
ncbi:hypothetical protein ACIQ9E_20415 [Streptomyces sp. NPDC094448]|uniref:hypothetical protein n=1 Tax=Streptomyces sp. NPDC094448 TaxID=3366063 RepID=UPI00381E924C